MLFDKLYLNFVLLVFPNLIILVLFFKDLIMWAKYWYFFSLLKEKKENNTLLEKSKY